MPVIKTRNYVRPTSVSEASQLLADENTLAVAGGTLVYILSAKGLLGEVDTIVDLETLGLSFVRVCEEKGELGATTKIQALVDRTDLPAVLREASLYVPKEVRNMGTIGGEVSAAYPYFDVACALMSLDTVVKLTDGSKTTSRSLDGFYRGILEPDVDKGRIVKSLEFPVNKFDFTKYKRKSLTAHGYGIASLALSLRRLQGVVEDIRVVAGGALSTPPTRLLDVEGKLKGRELNEELLSVAREAVMSSSYLKPTDDIKASSNYKRRLFSILLGEILDEVAR
ncbi:FAD binding domain-containing protein [Sulfodiicoccus acidiphilus]|nr:FAD binding domain-containing protein [Sulfodiicoccus acidiphilus]